MGIQPSMVWARALLFVDRIMRPLPPNMKKAEQRVPTEAPGQRWRQLIRATELRPVRDGRAADYRADIDGLRAIAVISVLLFHGGLPAFPGGFVGVDIFFVISGFLIGRIVLTQIAEGRFSFFSFYDRRARRILPPLIAVLIATLISGFALLLPKQLEALGFETITTELFGSNIWFWAQTGYFNPASLIQPLLHTWSLSIEEQFYLFMPPLCLGAYLMSPRLMLPAIGGVLVVSLVLSAQSVAYYPSASFFLLPTRAWELMVGVLLSASKLKAPPTTTVATAAGVIGLAFMLIAVAMFTERMPFPGYLALLPVGGSALVIWAGRTPNPASRLLSSGPAVFVGLLSYSLYLWHWPIYVAARHLNASFDLDLWQIAACVTLALIAAILSARYIEAPFRDRSKMPARLTYSILGIGIGVATSLALLAILTQGLPGRLSDSTLAFAAGSDDFSSPAGRCRNAPITPDMLVSCRIGADTPPSFLLWGDSHAAAVAPAVDQAAKRAGRSGILVSADGCAPLIDATQPGLTRIDRDRCLARTRELSRLLAQTPQLTTVILTARWYQEGSNPDIGMRKALGRTIGRLRASQRRVIVLAGLPVPEGDVPWLLAVNDRIRGPAPQMVHRQDAGAFYDQLNLWEREGRIEYISLAPALCTAQRCRAQLAGRAVFVDDNHLSTDAAKRLVGPWLAQASLFEATQAKIP